jgi:hypothetical protein
MPLDDYQFGIGDLVLGGQGNDYIVHGWSGFGSPAVRVSDMVRPIDHGVFYGPDFFTARTLTIDVTVRGDTPEEVVTNVDALLEEWYVDSRTDVDVVKALSVVLPGQDARRLHGRPRRSTLDPRRIIGNRCSGTLEYHAADPRWYSDTEHSAGFTLGTATTGRSYNKSFNYGYGGAGSSGTVQIDNAGNFLTRPNLTINGPVTNPFFENITAGKTITFTITLALGESLVVNFDARTVLLNGTASRYFTKSGDWWELAAGINDVRFGASAFDAAATATLYWRDAWL